MQHLIKALISISLILALLAGMIYTLDNKEEPYKVEVNHVNQIQKN